MMYVKYVYVKCTTAVCTCCTHAYYVECIKRENKERKAKTENTRKHFRTLSRVQEK